MIGDFYDEDFRVLTPEAFDFVLTNELKRAVRSQNFLTLVVFDAKEGEPGRKAKDPVGQVARLVSDEVRETDLVARTGERRLAMVLLDADREGSMRVIDRLLSRIEHYSFEQPMSIAVGAACCPTDATDVDTLRRHALERPVATRRTSGDSHSNA